MKFSSYTKALLEEAMKQERELSKKLIEIGIKDGTFKVTEEAIISLALTDLIEKRKKLLEK